MQINHQVNKKIDLRCWQEFRDCILRSGYHFKNVGHCLLIKLEGDEIFKCLLGTFNYWEWVMSEAYSFWINETLKKMQHLKGASLTNLQNIQNDLVMPFFKGFCPVKGLLYSYDHPRQTFAWISTAIDTSKKLSARNNGIIVILTVLFT